jgi:hypothetical protein
VSEKAPVPVHSIQEEHLFILLRACPCGQSYSLESQALTEIEDRKVDRVQAKCPDCGNREEFLFDVSGFFGDPDTYQSLRVNPTGEPSRAIDLEGWTRLALFYLALAAGTDAGPDRVQTEYMAAQCLDEGLKMFSPGDELPSVDAFFNTPGETERRALREQESFRRGNILELRKRLPPTAELRERIRRAAEKGGPEEKDQPAG